MSHAEERTCPHCHGTTFCGGSVGPDGSLATQPACTSCKAKSGLDVEQECWGVVCSVCRGTGLLRAPFSPARETDYLSRSLYLDRLDQARFPGRLLRNLVLTAVFAAGVVVFGFVGALFFYGR